MEHPALRHRMFSDLPEVIQLNIFHRIDSWLSIQKIRSALPELKRILPVTRRSPPHQYRDIVIPFFNDNGEVLSERAFFRTYDVFNYRDGGWVVQVRYQKKEDGSVSVRLMHPLTNLHLHETQFDIPRIMDAVRYDSIEMRSSYRLKSTVNSDKVRTLAFLPGSIWSVQDFMILMIWEWRQWEHKLALYKSVDQSWGIIEYHCVDVMCFHRDFYALEETGRTIMVHADCTTEEVVGPIVGDSGHKKRLVESGGDLLLVDQYYRNPNAKENNQRRTTRFVVFKFVEEENRWMIIHTLGERVLFVGYYNCFSAAAVDVAGARRDLIYFSEAFSADSEDEDEDGEAFEDGDEDEDEHEADGDVDEDDDEADGDEEDEDEHEANGDVDEDDDEADGDEEDEDEQEDGNDGNEEDMHGPGSKDEGEVGNEDEEGDDDPPGFAREDVAFFDMAEGIITELRNPAGAQFAVCFWPPPAWAADAAA